MADISKVQVGHFCHPHHLKYERVCFLCKVVPGLYQYERRPAHPPPPLSLPGGMYPNPSKKNKKRNQRNRQFAVAAAKKE